VSHVPSPSISFAAADLGHAAAQLRDHRSQRGAKRAPSPNGALFVALASVAIAALCVVAAGEVLRGVVADPERPARFDILKIAGLVLVAGAVLGAGFWHWARAVRRSGADLARRERLLEAIAREAPVGIVVLGGDGEVITWNPQAERLLGWTEVEVLGKAAPWEADDASVLSWIGRVRLGERLTDAETRLRRKDGSSVDAIVSAAPLHNGDRTTGVVAVLVDVTQQRRLEAQLRQAQKMEVLGQVAGGIAHDFRNVLTVMSTVGEAIRSRLPPEEGELQSDIAELLHAAERGTAITRRLLLFSRLEELKLGPTDLRTEVQDAVSVLRRLLPGTIEVTADLPHDAVPVNVDSNAMIHILANLATNARDAMPEGGRLRLAVRVTEDGGAERALLEVVDTGGGIASDTLGKVFDPFFTTKPAGIGTGLGLPIVQGLMAEQGGTMSLDSRVGHGTTVRLFFPLAPATLTRAAPIPGVIRGGTEAILVVEDEEAIRRTAQRGLEHLGYTVLVAADGAEALALLRGGRRVDLVISDCVMPRMGGIEFRERLLRDGINVRFLLASGYWPEEHGGAPIPPPGVPFLPKPWTLNELARKVREVLDQE
jgi:two-component system cell cycle sensor histidine kinase/response regulator CckA